MKANLVFPCLAVTVLLVAGCEEDTKTKSPTLTLEVNYPTATRSVHVADDPTIRTVRFEYTGVDVPTCSRDGGDSYDLCDSGEDGEGSLVWSVADYGEPHVIRVGSGKNALKEEFTPSASYPGLEFVDCTSNVTASENFDAFDARIAPGAVICLGEGVVVSRTGAAIATLSLASADNIVIIAREGDTATIRNATDANTVLDTDGADGVRLVGLSLEYTATGTSGNALRIDSGSLDLLLEDSSLDCPNGELRCIEAFAVGSTVGPIVISGSEITVPTVGVNFNSVGVMHDGGGTLQILNSTISAGMQPVWFRDGAATTGSLTISGATLTSTRSGSISGGAVELQSLGSAGTTAVIEESVIRTAAINAISLRNSAPITLTLDNNTVIRSTVSAGVTDRVGLDTSASGMVINSTQGNLFCNDSTATVGFLRIASGIAFTGTFSLANQTPSNEVFGGSAATFSDCP